MTERRTMVRGAVAAALLLALLLRLWGLADRPLWLDESWSRWMTEQDWPGLYAAARGYDSHPPFYYGLLKLWTCLVPASPLGLRSLSILAGLAMLPLAWLVAREVGPLRRERWTGPLLLVAVAATPALIVASRQARPYALFALAVAIALWAALSLARRHDWRVWLVYLAAIEFTAWIHGLGILFALSLAGGLFLALALAGRLRSAIVPFLAVHAAAGLAWIPCLIILIEQRRVWDHTWLRFSPADVPLDLAAGLSAPGPTGLLVLVLALFGAVALGRSGGDRPAAIILVGAAFGPAAATIGLSILSTPVFLPRTLAPSALPVLILGAAGAAAITVHRIRTAVAALSIALLTVTAIVEVRRPPEEQWDRLSGWLAANVQPGEEVWLLPNELALPLAYARRGAPFSARGIPASFPAPDHPGPRYSGTMAVPGIADGDAERLVREARARGLTGIWLVSRFGSLFDPENRLEDALGAPDTTQSAFTPLIVRHYRLD